MDEIKPARPEMPEERPVTDEDDRMEFLKREKELVGMYLSAHPLDKYSFEIENKRDICKITPSNADQLSPEYVR